ncbi:hypothetical protein BDP27DRAFT_1498226, partial [Rhodocollybia butyracea]
HLHVIVGILKLPLKPKLRVISTITNSLPQTTPEPQWLRLAESRTGYELGGYRPTVIGERLHSERYEILRKLGHGMQSTVWLAQDRNHLKGICVALKFLPL